MSGAAMSDLINQLIGSVDRPFVDHEELRRAANEDIGGGWWCDLNSTEAKALAKLLCLLIDTGLAPGGTQT
jgi:hypothetical protein